MSEAYDYSKDRYNDEEELDEEDEMRMAILEAEANEVWLEEPGDEEDEENLQMNPLFGLFSHGVPNIPGTHSEGENQ